MGNLRDQLRSRRRILAGIFSAGLLLAATGCMGQSKVGKLQEAASNLNMATRFGRMDIATELVAQKEMDNFAQRHAAWGGPVRIVDVEYQGLKFVGNDKAIVFVAVGWQRLDEGNLRVTHIAQEWGYEGNGWKLADETRTSGDVGLIGEPMEYLRPEERPNVHFPSITIR
jgi:tryptophanyl-tRNA synthetase